MSFSDSGCASGGVAARNTPSRLLADHVTAEAEVAAVVAVQQLEHSSTAVAEVLAAA